MLVLTIETPSNANQHEFGQDSRSIFLMNQTPEEPKMQLSKILVFTVSLTVLALHVPGTAAAAKKEENDGRVCVRLGVETNHPLVKVCTRKVETVEASRWYRDKESVHFVFLRSGDAFKSGHIKYSMDGGVKFEPGELDFCVMEVPPFRGTEEESLAHNTAVLTAYYFAAKSSGNDFTGPRSTKFTLRNKNGYFPENCDVVAATGESWKRSWTKVIEDVSLRSSPNSKFGQEFKQGFTDSLRDLSLAFSITPEQIEQGHLTAKSELQKAEQHLQDATAKNAERVEDGVTDGLLFVKFDSSANVFCHRDESELVRTLLEPPGEPAFLADEWGISGATRYASLEDIFAAAVAGQCGGGVVSPSDAGKLREALAKRSIDSKLGSVYISESEISEIVVGIQEARKAEEERLRAQQEQERLAAEQREKEQAERAERERLAAIEAEKQRKREAEDRVAAMAPELRSVMKSIEGSHCVAHQRDMGGVKSSTIWKYDMSANGQYAVYHFKYSNNVGVPNDDDWREFRVGSYVVTEARYSDTGMKYYQTLDTGKYGPIQPNLVIDKKTGGISAYNGREYLGAAKDCSAFD